MSRPYHERTADGLVLCADPADAVRLGLLRAFLLPVLLIFLAGLVGLVVVEDLPKAPGFLVLLSLPFALASSIWGFAQVALAGRSAAKTRAVCRDGTLRLADGRTVSRSAIAKVVADQPSKALKWKAIRVVGADGQLTLVLGGLPPGRGPEIAAAAEALAAEIGVAVEAEEVRKATAFGLEGSSWAALCYLPFQGIGLGASCISLLLSKDPFVRFCAKQSLLWFGVSTSAILAVLVIGLAPSLFLPDEAAIALAILTGGCVLVLALVRIGVFVVAAWKAWHGVPWLIPGVSAISGRWLLEAQGGGVVEKVVDAGVWTPPVGG